MSLQNMSDLLEDQLKDLYSAENQLLKALPKMAKKASTPKLQQAFEMHTRETEEHVERLKQVCQSLDFRPTGKVCKAMKGLIEEGNEAMKEDGEEAMVDAAIIAAAQKVEHYEISGYGTAVAIAEALGHKDVARILKKTELEEGNTDKKLTAISENQLLHA
jgi:ferritin-like metal-binding protein YciE